ncbi:uncharacterized protein LOC143283528 [Babylonia areolata]|uniref:uncharacterized protein LOC143283528 n=1 Tax=Babylonia areolata TaxID=304850 RepID=UPI003FD280F1
MSLRRTVLVLAVAVVLLMGLMAVDSHRGRRSRRYSRSSRYSKPPPRTIVTNTTRYGDSNVCKMCTTSTFHCNETFYRGCPPNYTDKGKRDDDDDGRRRGRRHATHHHSHEHHDRWNEWNNNNRQESTNNASSAKLVAVYAGGRKCKYELPKTCTESKCEVKCCDGTEKEPGSNSCKNRRRNDGTLNGCLNGGTLNSGRTHCTCPEDFVGLQCQHRKCAKSCQNGGQCKTNTTHTAGRQGDTSYNDDYCVCPSETSGEFCEKKICDKDCKNNGTCVRRGRSWTYCMCQPGFSGSECEKKMKEGECPMRQDSGSVCTWYNRKYTCFHDEDCEGSKKCCRDQCFARECVEPASPNVTCSYSGAPIGSFSSHFAVVDTKCELV